MINISCALVGLGNIGFEYKKSFINNFQNHAKALHSIKKINSTIENYFLKRKQLLAAFLLIDIRHECLNIDLNFMKWLNQNLIPFDIIITKADKLKSHEIEDHKNNYINCLLKFWSKTPKIFITSSRTFKFPL